MPIIDNPPNITDVAGMVEYANSGVNYMIGPMALIVIFMIALITFSYGRYKPAESITASLWITALLSVYMATVPNLLDGSIALFLIIVAGLSSLLLWSSD